MVELKKDTTNLNTCPDFRETERIMIKCENDEMIE